MLPILSRSDTKATMNPPPNPPPDPPPNPPPTGRQFEIAAAAHRATIVEVGAALRTFTVGSRDRIEGYSVDEMGSGSRGQVLAPWPNRIAAGSYDFGGAHHQLALNEPALGNAIHGLVRWVNWTVDAHDSDRVAMSHTLHPQPGYPFTLGLDIEYRLADDGLRVHLRATNLGADRCPYGAGFHPYLRLDPARIDRLELHAPAATYFPSDGHKIPTGRAPVADSPFDFRAARAIGATQMDHAFTDIERDPDGRATVRLRDPATGDTVALWFDAGYPYLMLFTGDSLPDAHRRRAGLAVEPMTCAPNAFRTGDGLVHLEPGAVASGSWGISASRGPS
jgi:aldose 1-epimerase